MNADVDATHKKVVPKRLLSALKGHHLDKTEKQAPEEPPKDVREFCEHIRTVQLSLLGICLLLLGVVMQDKPRPLSAALQDLNAIAKIGEKKPEITGALQAFVDSEFDRYSRMNRQNLQMGIPAYILVQQPEGTKRSFRLNFPARWAGTGPFQAAPSRAAYEVATPGEFQTFWEACLHAQIHFAAAFNGTETMWLDELNGNPRRDLKVLAYTTDPKQFKEKVRAALSSTETQTETQLDPVEVNLQPSPMLDYFQSSTGQGNEQLLIQLPELTLQVNMLPAFLQAVGLQGKWKPLPFTQAFGELSAQMSEVSNLSFEDARKSLEQKSKALAKEEPIEVFGAKLPVEKIKDWGIVIVLGVQIYLVILVAQLALLFSKYKQAVLAWSGLFPGIVARGFTLISCAILPLGVVAYLALHKGSVESSNTQLDVIGGLLSIVVSTLVMVNLRAIWQRLG